VNLEKSILQGTYLLMIVFTALTLLMLGGCGGSNGNGGIGGGADTNKNGGVLPVPTPPVVPTATITPTPVPIATSSADYNYLTLPIGPMSGCSNISDCDNETLWTSLTVPSNVISQNFFVTDATLSVRFKVEVPPVSCLNATGNTVHDDRGYDLLGLRVTLSSKEQANNLGTSNAKYLANYVFGLVPVGESSPIYTFTNIPVTSGPLILQVNGVRFDLLNLGGTSGSMGGFFMSKLGCWKITLQVATDYTAPLQ
jgi:hypothetical protein